MRNCEPYNEVSKKTLNPYYLQQGTASFDDEQYKSSLFNRIQSNADFIYSIASCYIHS